MDLAKEYQALIDQGLIRPAEDAPQMEPLAKLRARQAKTVYNIGDAVVSAENTENAKLDSGFRRNTKDKF